MPVTKVKKKSNDGLAALVDDILLMMKSGNLDEHLTALDDALSERIDAQEQEKREQQKEVVAKERATTRTVPQPTRKSAAPAFVPDVNGTYLVAGGNKSLEGKKVKFLRFRKDDEKKAVVEMLEDASGAPKGKKIVIPIVALKKPVAASRRAVVKKRKGTK